MEVKSIREHIEWDASWQEVEFRNIDYVNKNIGFKNCASEDTLKLNEVDWDDIFCLDLKFNFKHYMKQHKSVNYEEYFKYMKMFVESSGEKNLHPQIFVNARNFSLFKNDVLNRLNEIISLRVNEKNLLEFLSFRSLKKLFFVFYLHLCGNRSTFL